MSTTTTNFGWTVPSDTDLVKDGAAAIRTALGGVDTSFVDLKGGTSGQVLSKASGTDLDFTWVAQDDSNAIQNAIVDAKGDLIAATAADTPARLAVGTNGQVLTADSTASTGLAWTTPATVTAGITFIAKSSASAVSSHTISNCFTSAYTNYRVVFNITGVSDANVDLTIQMASSGTPTTSGYNSERLFGGGASANADSDNQGTDEWNFLYVSSAYPTAGFGSMEFGTPQVATTSGFNSFGYARNAGTQYFFINGGILNNSTQYDGFKILCATGTFSGDFYIYGYQKA